MKGQINAMKHIHSVQAPIDLIPYNPWGSDYGLGRPDHYQGTPEERDSAYKILFDTSSALVDELSTQHPYDSEANPHLEPPVYSLGQLVITRINAHTVELGSISLLSGEELYGNNSDKFCLASAEVSADRAIYRTALLDQEPTDWESNIRTLIDKYAIGDAALGKELSTNQAGSLALCMHAIKKLVIEANKRD